MHQYVVYHRHAPSDCAASFAAWNGFHSELRPEPEGSLRPFEPSGWLRLVAQHGPDRDDSRRRSS